MTGAIIGVGGSVFLIAVVIFVIVKALAKSCKDYWAKGWDDCEADEDEDCETDETGK